MLLYVSEFENRLSMLHNYYESLVKNNPLQISFKSRFFFFFRWNFALVAQATYNGMISAYHNLYLPGSSDPPVLVAGITGVCHHTQLILYFYSRNGVFPCWLGSNSRLQVICPPQPPKVLELQV